MPQQWRFAAHDRAIVTRLARELSISPLLAQVLASRGIDSEVAGRQFLSASIGDLHSPELLPGISDAAERIVSAIRERRRITIYGDYDVDGVTATSILWHCLKLAGAQVDYYIPCRIEEGYGLNLEALRTLHAEDPHRLIVTVDCGICSLQEAELARELGLELIITDHHTMTDRLPNAAVTVHPRLPGSTYPFPELCGAGVAFKLAWCVCQRLGDGTKASPRMREYLKAAVGLAALGTIADVVPMTGENRILVRYGLGTLQGSPLPGLEMLQKVAGFEKARRLTSEDVAFGLAPRINAAGRLGQARLAVDLLTTDNRMRAAQLADYLDQLNKNRQSVERKIFKLAKEQVEEHPHWQDHAALVLAGEDWHPGVIGIVASRVAEHFQRPTVMVSLNSQTGVGHGSGRSFADADLHGGLAACQHLLEGFGGHRAAAGLRIRADRVEQFREAFAAFMASQTSTEGTCDPELHVDAEISVHDLTHSAVRELEHLGPYGPSHRRPVFCIGRVDLADEPTTMGGGGRHLSLRIRQGEKHLRCIAFGRGEWAAELGQVGAPISICFTAGLNSYRGYESVELQLVDWRKDDSSCNPHSSTTVSSEAS